MRIRVEEDVGKATGSELLLKNVCKFFEEECTKGEALKVCEDGRGEPAERTH